MWNSYRWNNAIGPNRHRDGHYRSHMYHRQTHPVYFLRQRCTATRIRPSGGGKDYPTNIRLFQFFGNLLAKLLGVGNRGGITYRNIVAVI